MTVIRGGMGATSDQAVTGVLRMLGFKLTSAQIRLGMEAGIGRLRAKGKIMEQQGMLIDFGLVRF